MSHDPWWRSWTVEELSPLNPLAVATAQLCPPEWDKVYRHMYTERQWAQLFWLCWYARPDLRKQQLTELMKLQCRLSLSQHELPFVKAIVHPETFAEWAELPQWADTWTCQAEWGLRVTILCSIPLTVEQCLTLHPHTWNPMCVEFQAVQSARHKKWFTYRARRLQQQR